MGFFSWKTQDTNKSISNTYSIRPVFKVIMTDDKGNQWIEKNYEGYGVFDGKDYYELVDEMNGGLGDRNVGIERQFNRQLGVDKKYKNQIFPSLSENGDYYNGVAPENCEDQGFFYEEEEAEIYKD